MTTDLVQLLRQQKQIVPTLAIGKFAVGDNPICNQAADLIEALIAERDALITRNADLAYEAGEWKGRYTAAGYPGTLDGWITRVDATEAERDALRAENERLRYLTEVAEEVARQSKAETVTAKLREEDAEAKLREAVKVVRHYACRCHESVGDCSPSDCYDINCGWCARTFLASVEGVQP